jgi:hypothetical protein
LDFNTGDYVFISIMAIFVVIIAGLLAGWKGNSMKLKILLTTLLIATSLSVSALLEALYWGARLLCVWNERKKLKCFIIVINISSI